MKGIYEYKGKNKRTWQVVVPLGKDPATGKYRQKRITVEGSKKDAEKAMRDLLKKRDDGINIDYSKITLWDYLDKWFEDSCKPNLAPKTLKSYSMIIEKHLKPALGALPLIKLQPLHLQEYYSKALKEGRMDNKKTKGRSLSSTTVLRHHRVLHKALEQAVKWEMVSRNVADAVDPPKQAKQEMSTLNPEQIAQVLNELEGTYLYMPVYLAVSTGMRAGEILGLQWKNVDLEAGTVAICQTLQGSKKEGLVFRQPKTDYSRRCIEIGESVVATMRRHKVQHAKDKLSFGEAYQDLGLVCCLQDGSPINPGTLGSRWQAISGKLNLGVRFHDLRHTHATLLLQLGERPKVISERLGHSGIGITMDLYSHVTPAMQKEAASRLENLLFGKAAK